MKLIQKISEPLSVRWLIVGVTSLVIDIFGFAFGFKITKSIFTANFIAATLSTSFNYMAHYFWTFSSRGSHIQTILKYYLNISFIWIVSSLLIKYLVINHFDALTAKILSLLIILPLNFFTLKLFVYQNQY